MPVKVARNRFHIDKRAASLLSASDADGDDLLTTREVADWLGVSPQWLAIGRVKKYGLEFVRVSSRHLAYRRSAVRAWLESRTYSSTSEYAK